MVWPFSTQMAGEPQAAASACPVDHTTREKWEAQAKCPVDHTARATMLDAAKKQASTSGSSSLSQDREVSSIPRYYMNGESAPAESSHSPNDTAIEERESHWVYPSPEQFYTAVRRKNHNARAEDMSVVVPIHNAVNEEAWRRILDWEKLWQSDPSAPGPQLVNFVGRPRDVTWRAWMRGLAGYQMPFDRHDWTIVRPGSQGDTPRTMRYIIDFYAGRATSSSEVMGQAQPVSFHLDVRPAPSTIEGIAMRVHRLFHDISL